MKRILTVTITLIFILISICYSLETDTHEALNEYVSRNTLNSFSFNLYLKNNLGIQNGIEEDFNSKQVWKWLREGGKKEDIPYWYMPYLRSVNHFHNPLTKQGFSGIWGMGFLNGVSSLEWSQKPMGTQSPGGYYSWYDARDYFYKALTSADKITREANFAETLRGLGQLMHLVEDLSVPEHTRDDGHYTFYNYEKWVKDTVNIKIIPSTGIISIRDTDLQNYVNITPIFFDPSSLGNPSQFAFYDVPIANLFDNRQYDAYGSNPDSTLQNNIGLSEYTNANFLSPDSMFSSAFPYPNWASVVEYDEINAMTGRKTTYLRKLGKDETAAGKIGNGEHVEHLAAGRWGYKLLPSWLKQNGSYLKMDDKVHSDYAQKLIPRAVGYSAGLLDYFFRGTLEISAPDAYVYSIIDGSINPQQFTKITAKVRNSTPDSIPGEEIQNCDVQQQNCILQAVARYKKRTDYQSDLSADPPTADSREADFSYSVSAPIAIVSLSSTTPTEFTFDFTNSPIPVGITDLYFHVIFKGTLGNENDIAIAVGMKNLNEPDHYSLWNSTDQYVLYGNLYYPVEIKNNPTLASRVDFDGDGVFNEVSEGEPYIDPCNATYQIAYSESDPKTNPDIVLYLSATINDIPAARYSKLIILTDTPDNYYMTINRQTTCPADKDKTYYFQDAGVINQMIDGVWTSTPLIPSAYVHRGVRQYHFSASYGCYPDIINGQLCPYHEETRPIPDDLTPYPAILSFP